MADAAMRDPDKEGVTFAEGGPLLVPAALQFVNIEQFTLFLTTGHRIEERYGLWRDHNISDSYFLCAKTLTNTKKLNFKDAFQSMFTFSQQAKYKKDD